MLEYQEMDPREWKECALLAAAAFYDYAKERGAETLSLFTNSELNKKFYVKNGFSEFDEKQFRHEGKTIGSWSYVMRFCSGAVWLIDSAKPFLLYASCSRTK